MAVYGYARVSSKEQNLDRQIQQLSQYVETDKILMDKASGKDLNRPAYQALKGTLGLRLGDTLVITSLDRLSRNKDQIRKELEYIKRNGIQLKILDLPTSLITVPEGQTWILELITNILIEVLSSMAEQERLTIRKRQAEGIAAAKKKGKHLGRPKLKIPEDFQEVYERWKNHEITAKWAMKKLQVSSSSFYRMVKEFEDSNESKGR